MGAHVIGLVLVVLSACQLSYRGGAQAVSAHALAPGWLHAAPTPVITQRQPQDCGLAALAMVAGAWGRRWSVVEMAHQLRPTRRGLTLGALRDLARARDLDAYAIRGSHADLAHELGAGRPVLLGLVLPYDRQRALHHYEVAVALDPATGAVITRDPATGQLRRRSRAVLEREWLTAGHATLVVVGDRAVRQAAR